MTMTRGQLTDSLSLWTEREERFRRNWRSKKKADPRRYYWFKQLKNAVRKADKRRDQLQALRPTGVSQRGLDLIKEFEGFRSRPYRDPVGVWTVGYGETRGVSRFTIPWSMAKATAALKRRVDRDFYPAVRDAAKAGGVGLGQNKVDALCSFAYNLGAGIFAPGSSIGDALRRGSSDGVAKAILLYDKAGKPPRPLPGLTRRRKAEHDLFVS